MAVARSVGGNLMADNVNYEDCVSKFILINDENYKQVINWFKACLKLSQTLSPTEKDEYELNLIGHVKNVLTEFFQRTELSLSTLIGIEKEITTMFQPLTPAAGAKNKDIISDSKLMCTVTYPLLNPPCCDIEDALEVLYKKIAWLASAAILLLILLVIIMCCLCWLRKCIDYEMQEAFANCPGGEDEGEEEEEDYGIYPALAYPMRVWLNPLAGKKPPAKKVGKKKQLNKIQEKKDSKTKNGPEEHAQLSQQSPQNRLHAAAQSHQQHSARHPQHLK